MKRLEALLLLRVVPPIFQELMASADSNCAVRLYVGVSSSVQGKSVSRFEQVTFTSNGVLIVQWAVPTVLVTPERTVPPNACIAPKLMVAEFVPEPPSVKPLASDCNVKVSAHRIGKH